jgi:hypothetical protein
MYLILTGEEAAPMMVVGRPAAMPEVRTEMPYLLEYLQARRWLEDPGGAMI